MSAFELLAKLQNEASPRRAGTSGEARAQEWLLERCASLGLPSETDEFTFIGSATYRPVVQLVIVTLITLSIAAAFLGYPLVGGVTLLLTFYFYFYPLARLEERLAGSKSRNILAGLERPISAYVQDENKKPAVLLCAHYDTPRNFPSYTKVQRKLTRVFGPLGLLGLVLYAVFTIFLAGAYVAEAIGWPAFKSFLLAIAPYISWLALIMALPLLVLLTFSSFSLLFSKSSDSPGADDNGSGTAMVLELAERLKANPPQNFEVYFAWWGAEELGLFGSRQFVRRHHKQLEREKLYLINIDCVGVGQYLTVTTGVGTIKRHHSATHIVKLLEELAAEQGTPTLRTWGSIISGGSSDHATWMERGFNQAVSLIRENYRPLSLPARFFAWLLRIPDAAQFDIGHVHTPADSLDGINPQILEETANLAEAYIHAIDNTLSLG